jgi:vesicle-fusing ATPase
MKEVGGLSGDAVEWIEDMGENGLPAITKHYSGAELAGLVRSAASFALGRTMTDDEDAGVVSKSDLKESLKEVRAALGKQDELLKPRYPLGISLCSTSMRRITRDLERFTRPLASRAPRLQSLLLVGSGGTGVTSLAAWAATGASENGSTDYVRFISALDLIVDGGNEAARSVALAAKFDEAREMEHALLILDDVDQLCAGSSPAGYSSVMIATLRALLRSPPPSNPASKAVDADKPKLGKSIHVIATSSRADAACSILYELFDDTIGEWQHFVI